MTSPRAFPWRTAPAWYAVSFPAAISSLRQSLRVAGPPVGREAIEEGPDLGAVEQADLGDVADERGEIRVVDLGGWIGDRRACGGAGPRRGRRLPDLGRLGVGPRRPFLVIGSGHFHRWGHLEKPCGSIGPDCPIGLGTGPGKEPPGGRGSA